MIIGYTFAILQCTYTGRLPINFVGMCIRLYFKCLWNMYQNTFYIFLRDLDTRRVSGKPSFISQLSKVKYVIMYVNSFPFIYASFIIKKQTKYKVKLHNSSKRCWRLKSNKYALYRFSCAKSFDMRCVFHESLALDFRCAFMTKVIIDMSCGGRFLWNRN
jgi:hypothetical protein